MPNIRQGRLLAGLYWVVVIAFSTLEPWGNIDTRDFSYMGPFKFWAYNAYITLQMLAMLVLSVLLWNGRAGMKSLLWIAAVNALFISMNLFDLFHFFPDPAQPLPFLVTFIECATSLAAFCILLLAPAAVRSGAR